MAQTIARRRLRGSRHQAAVLLFLSGWSFRAVGALLRVPTATVVEAVRKHGRRR